MKEFDYLIVGAGLFGSVFAHEVTKWGRKCLLVERRKHLGGTCYSQNRDGIDVHMHGPHIFHTSCEVTWSYINNFAQFNNYRHTVKADFHGKLYTLPVNLTTLEQVYGHGSADQLLARLEAECAPYRDRDRDNLEDWCLANIGPSLYLKFIKGYTIKHWHHHPRTLQASIIKRLPLRKDYNDSYFDHQYQGIPIGGYTRIFKRLLKNVTVRLDCDYFANRSYLDALSDKIVFTGEIDRFFHYRHGRLEWRSLEFRHKRHETKDWQGCSVINYTDKSVPYIRSVEYRHFSPELTRDIPVTHVVKEYPANVNDTGEVYYPVPANSNQKIYNCYQSMAEKLKRNVIFGGRLANYKYIDMAPVIQSALEATHDEQKNVL